MPKVTETTEKKPMKKVTKPAVLESKTPVAAPKATKGVSIDVFDIKGAKTTMTLPAEIFDAKINKQLMAQAIRVYMANQRMGTAASKTRGEVQGSTRKIYQQKGTGRARHGGIRAPIFVGGGVAHGPRPHDFGLAMPRKMKKQALFSALSSKKRDGGMMVIKGLSSIESKTKAMVSVLKNIGMEKTKKSVLLVLPIKAESGVLRSSRNIAGVTMMPVTQLNTYEVLKSHTLLFMQEAIEEIKI